MFSQSSFCTSSFCKSSLRKGAASLASTSLAMLTAVSQAAAGGRTLECYEPVHRPAIYDTVYEDVMVSPGGQLVHYDAPIYGTTESIEQIATPRISYEVVPAVTRTVYHTVKVDDGGYAWEWRVIHGRKVLCKVWREARYARVAKAGCQNGHRRAGARPARRPSGRIRRRGPRGAGAARRAAHHGNRALIPEGSAAGGGAGRLDRLAAGAYPAALRGLAGKSRGGVSDRVGMASPAGKPA
ncbi:hypothetical protein [Mesorhizobium sp. WSM3868]|uniref:hypothetical protein n=1 Tax=Mesorhizobium sp. WSM3868 TaxID=2029405 RepID=UPI0032AF7CCC